MPALPARARYGPGIAAGILITSMLLPPVAAYARQYAYAQALQLPDLRRRRAGVAGAGHTLAQPPAGLVARQRRTPSWTGWPCCDPAGCLHRPGDQLAAPLYGQRACPEPWPGCRRDGYPAGRGHGSLAGTGQHANRTRSAIPPGTCRHGRGGHVDDLGTRLSHRHVRGFLVRRLSPRRARQPECRRRPADRCGHLVGSPCAVLPARHLRHGHRLAGRPRQLRRERAPGRIFQHACRLASPAPRLAFTAHPAVKTFQAHACHRDEAEARYLRATSLSAEAGPQGRRRRRDSQLALCYSGLCSRRPNRSARAGNSQRG